MLKPIDEKAIIAKVPIHKTDESQANNYSPGSHIYVRSVKGKHQHLRKMMNLGFMALFLLIPWLQFNGVQAVLFDIVEQKFHIFGITLWPQDFTLMALLLIISAFALFTVTAFYGRVWCGYLCPQTVWTFIFLWFEEKLEGTRNQRMKIDSQPMNWSKFWRKGVKHTAWMIVSLVTSLTFIAYFVPAQELFLGFVTFATGGLVTFWVWFFALCTYGNAGWMREIMCIHICPYARLQSVMFDKETFTVTYDYNRGESRGPRSKKQDPKKLGLGDCIDCNLCVHVCPTGIDIRNGLQYECINCGACVDACDDVMDKMGYDRGLIRYTTENDLHDKPTKVIRPKLIGYIAILILMLGLFGYDIATRVPLELDIMRDRNQMYRETFEGMIENVYTLKVLNKSQEDHRYTVEVSGLQDVVMHADLPIFVPSGEVYTLPVRLTVDPANLTLPITDIQFTLTHLAEDDDDISVVETSRFFKGGM